MELHDDRLNKLEKLFDSHNYAKYLEGAVAYLQNTPSFPGLLDETETKYDNFKRMLQCYADGMQDPKRKEIYQKSVASMYVLRNNLILNDKILNDSTLMAARKRSLGIDLMQAADYLEGEKDDEEYKASLFSAILVSKQWTPREAAYYIRLLVFSSVDNVTRCLLVSAIMMATLCMPDFQKFCCLVEVYKMSTNLYVKERALVGWVFASSLSIDICRHMMMSDVEELIKDDNIRKELVDLQKQIIYCLDAEKDSKQMMAQDIMKMQPSDMPWMKNDLDDSSLSEILHPEEDEEFVEKVEEHVAKMIKMERAGSDVYFGGFARMKSFAFFHRLSNWFLPYYIESPALEPVKQLFDGDTTFLTKLDENSPFCDSDKYSFSLAMVLTLKEDTMGLKSILKNGDLFADRNAQLDMDEPTVIRRMYLQDLFRFFRLSSFRNTFFNVFEDKKSSPAFFLHQWQFDSASDDVRKDMEDSTPTGKLNDLRMSICRFLLKRKDYKRLGCFVLAQDSCFSTEQIMINVLYLMNYKQAYHEAAMLLVLIPEEDAHTAPVLKALAKCFSEIGLYSDALSRYQMLQKIKPSASNRLKIAYCMLKCGQVDEAMDLLYELAYKDPDNVDVLRSLVWGNFLRGDLDKALSTYENLAKILSKNGQPMDVETIYNKGLCLWMKKDMKKAMQCFVQYQTQKSDKDESLIDKFLNDSDVLTGLGMDSYEFFIMWDTISNEINQ